MKTLLSSLAFCLTAFAPLTADVEAPEAPEFAGITNWINSRPLVLSDLRGRVVLLDFWSYSCINCLRTVPYLNRWYQEYKGKGFLVVGIHSPEFEFEHDETNVREAVKRYGIHYPVALDNHFDTWKAYKIHYWPTSILIDQKGGIVLRHIGEGNYAEMENAIRNLLGIAPYEHAQNPPQRKVTTPEIYLGSSRGTHYEPDMALKNDAVQGYSIKQPLGEDEVGLSGLWRVSEESVTSAGSNCKIVLNFLAGKVHIVLSGSSSDPITLQLDGKPLPEKYYTPDMDEEGQIFMDGDRKYDLVDLHGQMGRHTITISFPPGISAYSFTFGD